MPLILLHEKERQEWLAFREPAEVLQTWDPLQIPYLLRQLEERSRYHNRWAVGFLAYEASSAFDAALRTRDASSGSFPLAWFGLFDTPVVLPDLPSRGTDTFASGDWVHEIDRPEFESAIRQIREHIRNGDTYQVNFTFRMRSAFAGDPLGFFLDLQRRQPGGYGAYIECDTFAIASVSPELFFRRDGEHITTRPMKGTRRRGLTTASDRELREALRTSHKDRAENLMIVDMMRNDLNRIAISGSVTVPSLFEIEKYPTVWQMTSTITARTTRSWAEILGALFPCSSITGAPKIRTMEIIKSLEPSPRGIYTGSIGFLAPDGRSQMNVAIRTVAIDKTTGTATYGVGGGIVWDSQPEAEYDECRSKAAVLSGGTAAAPDRLLETMSVLPEEGVVLLEAHLERLSDSAEYFGFALDIGSIRSALLKLRSREARVLRLTVDRDGRVEMAESDLPESGRIRAAVAPTPVWSRDPLLYHKTTSRDVYDQALASRDDVDDVILKNERGELTEFTIGNLVLEIDRRLVTPPVSSGLLPGTLRQQLLDRGEVTEQLIGEDDLDSATTIFRINSVRGWQRVDLVP